MESTPELEQQKKDYLANLKVSQADVVRIMNVPQRTEEWLKARKGRITASNYGAATRHNPHCSTKQLLKNLLWSVFKGNAATRWGTEKEPVAADVYERFMEKYTQDEEGAFNVEYPGLIICQKYPWIACSPDGLPMKGLFRWLLEIKCPFARKFYPTVPHYYYDQIQGIMGVLHLPYADFVVWTPERTQIRRYAFDPDYWSKVLFPRLEDFYMNNYLPRLIMKENGKLKEGELEPTVYVETPKSSILDDFDFIWDKPSVAAPDAKRRKIQ
jgi:putative phage-type endonuclease